MDWYRYDFFQDSKRPHFSKTTFLSSFMDMWSALTHSYDTILAHVCHIIVVCVSLRTSNHSHHTSCTAGLLLTPPSPRKLQLKACTSMRSHERFPCNHYWPAYYSFFNTNSAKAKAHTNIHNLNIHVHTDTHCCADVNIYYNEVTSLILHCVLICLICYLPCSSVSH